MRWRRWTLVTLVFLLWPAAWALLWRGFLFESLIPSGSQGVTVYNDNGRSEEVLWIVTGFCAGLLLVAGTLFAYGGQIRRTSTVWGTGVCVVAAAVGLAALSLPFLFPRVEAVILDEVGETVALEVRWLYATERDTIAFADIDRIQFRHEGFRERGECYPVTTLKVFASDPRTQIAMPRDLRLESIAIEFSEATNVPIERIGGGC